MSLSICACVMKGNIPAVIPLIEAQLRGKYKELIVGNSPADFAAFKANSGESCALIVETNAGHAVIKDLCDDFAVAQRRVRFIYSLTAGVDAYNVQSLETELAGIPMYNAQGCYSNILAEHVIFSIGYFNRQCWRFTKNKHAKRFEKYNMKEIEGQKAVIVGYGSIGQATGKLCARLGMQVTGIRRTVDKSNPAVKEMFDEHGVAIQGQDALEVAIGEADFVIGVLPGTDATTHFFDRRFFTKMKPSAVFLNIGRGATQNEADLLEALQGGAIAGAALDVFNVEPLPAESPLWGLPDDKLLLTPHCADWTDQLMQKSTNRFVRIYEKTLAGIPVNEHTVDVRKGY